MNLYYHFGMQLDMKYFWKKQLSTVLYSSFLVCIFMILTSFLPVDTIGRFIVWGTLYVIAFIAVTWQFVLTVKERTVLYSKVQKILHC